MKRVFLIGYMGAGKTTVGKDLSRRLGLSFVDLDLYIENRYHKTVRELFAEKGEDTFREIERDMLHEVAAFEDIIISTGGGTPCFFDNMQFMKAQGVTVYLKVTVGELVARLDIHKSSRPVLAGRVGDELREFVEESLCEREPFYNLSSIVFNAEAMSDVFDVKNISIELAKII